MGRNNDKTVYIANYYSKNRCRYISIAEPFFSLDKATGWDTFKVNAKKWSELNLPVDHELHVYIEVFSQISDVTNAFGTVHNSCRTRLGTKYNEFLKAYGKIENNDDSVVNVDEKSNDEDVSDAPCVSSPVKTRSKLGGCDGRQCFVCNEKTPNDENAFFDQGLGRCTDEKAAVPIDQRKNDYLQDKMHRYHAAAHRLNLLLNGKSYDVFAQDVYYHKVCYVKFAHPYVARECVADDGRKQRILETFFTRYVKRY